ncbi:hypothetical protein ACP70R_003932 [Stipagrostis hirtigluma subsp. patula]
MEGPLRNRLQSTLSHHHMYLSPPPMATGEGAPGIHGLRFHATPSSEPWPRPHIPTASCSCSSPDPAVRASANKVFGVMPRRTSTSQLVFPEMLSRSSFA